ncbi:AraC family transcriptional regulator [Psychrobacillus sp.]|uniref:AraC family transcriptional regulator n=1 Tax=Psychrobacillus sp. TaxID=1871623 RepID=UPI0028BE648A|nr:AraC family transcriptional regulator [Psychrobacillus sp.]
MNEKTTNDYILLWNQATIKVLDVRHVVLKIGEELRSYRLPSSIFLFSTRGSARVVLDHTEYILKGMQLMHSGKGAIIDIESADEEFEYYLIFYKAFIPSVGNKRWVDLLILNNPFQKQYSFSPSYPISLYQKVQTMQEEWKKMSSLNTFHIKSLFYQFVYSILLELHRYGIEVKEPDLTTQVKFYIQENYSKLITLESLAVTFSYSAPHLSALFKQNTSYSPIDYLIRTRIERASKSLVETDASLRDVAASVGYEDVYYFSRLFKKKKGISPTQYRMREMNRMKTGDSPVIVHGYSIVGSKSQRYIDIDNHYQYGDEGDLPMNKRTRTSMATLLVCLTLLLSACTGGITNTSGSSQVTANSVESQKNSENSNVGHQVKTRTVSTLKGDIEVPAEPQRVASDQYMGQLLKLGIIPVGVREGMLTEAWIDKAGISKDILSNIESLGGFPMNAEKLIDLEPDLIIGSIEDNIEQYEKIGTTVFLPYWEGLSTASPIEKFKRISEIFGKEQEADKWIEEYEQKVEHARKQIEGIINEGETVSVVQLSEKAMYVLAAEGGNYGSTTIYQMLQLPPTKKALEMKEGFENVSLEVLPEYLGDHVFVYVNSKKDAEEILSSSVWKGVPAVKKGQVYIYGEFGDEFVMEDPYSLELQLETIVKVLSENKK